MEALASRPAHRSGVITMKDRILITGISGFIGQALEKRFLAEGYEVHGVYESTKSMLEKNSLEVIRHKGNLKDYGAMVKIVKNVKPHFVIHLAAKTEVALSFDNYLEVSEVNYLGTVNLAEACRKFAGDLKLFMMASTMETYGHQLTKVGADAVAKGDLLMPPPFTEDTPQHPMAPYAVAKMACEKYLEYMEYSYRFPWMAFRQTNAYGRHDNNFFVVEQIISQMLENPNEISIGAPEPYRNFIHIDDLVELYMAVIQNPDKARGQFFVTGPANALTIAALAEKIKGLMKWEGTINWGQKPPRPGEVYYLNSNPAKAKQVLGWEPKISLDEGLERTIRIWREKYVSQKSQQVRSGEPQRA